MQQFEALPERERGLFPDLTAAEYRLLADLLIAHIEVEDCQNQRLEDLADHLYKLAVRTDARVTSKAN